MEVIRMPAGIYAANCYIVYDENAKEGIVVDPGGDVDDIINRIEKLGLTIKYIVLTHGHGDHIAGVKGLKNHTGAKVAIHKDDAYMVRDGRKNLSSMMAMGTVEFEPDILLDENDVIEFGNIKCKVIHTPGHTPGGITLRIGDSLFTGDTLFAGSIGRTDFEGGSFDTIINSIKTKLMVFPDDTKVYPGHGPSTTIKMEKRYNPFIR
ncbi:MAG TPA: MBL fold metallo-hydrolase [Tissierellia bacterium]|nr:MBL fold metallo-hydrolase [Tissierellia bacterium]